MGRTSFTTASFLFTGSRARFMGAGYALLGT